MSMAYLLSWKGPVLEADDPYGDGVSPAGLKAVKHVQESNWCREKIMKRLSGPFCSTEAYKAPYTLP